MSHSSLPSRISFFCELILARTSVSTCSSSFSSAVRMVTISWRMVSRSSMKSTPWLETRKSMMRWESRTDFSRLRRILTENQFPFAGQLSLHLLEHLLIGDTGAAHFVGITAEDFADFVVYAVLDGDFVGHDLADLLRKILDVLRFDHLAGDQPLDDFLGHVADIIAREQHVVGLRSAGAANSV